MFVKDKNELELLDKVLRVYKTILFKHLKITAKDNHMLNFAIKKGSIDIVKYFLRNPETDVNSAHNDLSSPLYLAIKKGNKDIIKLLLEHPKIDVNKVSSNNNETTPLYLAVKKADKDSVELLLKHHKIDVNKGTVKTKKRRTNESGIWIKEREYITPLYLAASKGHKKNIKIVELLLKHPNIDVNKFGPIFLNGSLCMSLTVDLCKTPLSIATWKGYECTVSLLLNKRGIEIDKLTVENIKKKLRFARPVRLTSNSNVYWRTINLENLCLNLREELKKLEDMHVYLGRKKIITKLNYINIYKLLLPYS
jgi:ankyrin repeat protein